MPETLHLHASSQDGIEKAAAILRAGGTVAFPTETVYGLGANALQAEAVAAIFVAKQRPSWDPVIVHLSEAKELTRVAEVPAEVKERVDLLSKTFWPGPLTLLLPRNSSVPQAVTAGRPLVGIRIPEHPVAQALLRAAGIPVAAPSANLFGHTSPTTAAHVLADLDGRIDAVLDGGPTPVGVESTVLDPGPTPMVLYRPGAVTAEAIQEATGVAVRTFELAESIQTPPEALPSPGVGIRHYAPRARVVLVEEGSQDALQDAVRKAQPGITGEIGVLLPEGWDLENLGGKTVTERWGRWDEPSSLATRIFAALRALDDQGVEVIVCPLPGPGGLRDAIRDRLLKAARAK